MGNNNLSRRRTDSNCDFVPVFYLGPTGPTGATGKYDYFYNKINRNYTSLIPIFNCLTLVNKKMLNKVI